MLNTEAMSQVHVAYGTVVNELKEVSSSYKEAKMALDVGKIFYSNKNVVAYAKPWHWPSDLSASDSAVSYVYQGDL